MSDVKYFSASNLHTAQLKCLEDIDCAYITRQQRPEIAESINYRLCNKNSKMVYDYYGTTYATPGTLHSICY